MSPPRRVLDQRALGRAVLARQSLLARARLPLPAVLERICGLQTQYAPSAYLGLWSRVDGMRRELLTAALTGRGVVQATLMRTTIHTVSAGDYWPLADAVRQARRQYWLTRVRPRPSEEAVLDAARRVRARLEAGPARQRELITSLALDRQVWQGVGLWLDLIRVPPSGTWDRRRADLYGLAEHWLPRRPPDDPERAEQAGIDLLIRRYLSGFGPATARDVQRFTGLPDPVIAAACARLPLRRLRDEDGAELIDLPGTPLPDPDTPAPVRFLPTWDSTLLGHARRAQILPERFRPRVFATTMPQSVPTFLVDGQVAGTWRYLPGTGSGRDCGRIELEPFEPLPAGVRAELADEAERLAAFHAQ